MLPYAQSEIKGIPWTYAEKINNELVKFLA
jgi:hypothetical protein